MDAQDEEKPTAEEAAKDRIFNYKLALAGVVFTSVWFIYKLSTRWGVELPDGASIAWWAVTLAPAGGAILSERSPQQEKYLLRILAWCLSVLSVSMAFVPMMHLASYGGKHVMCLLNQDAWSESHASLTGKVVSYLCQSGECSGWTEEETPRGYKVEVASRPWYEPHFVDTRVECPTLLLPAPLGKFPKLGAKVSFPEEYCSNPARRPRL